MFISVDGRKNKTGMFPHVFYLMEIEQFVTTINPVSNRLDGRYRYYSEFYNSEYVDNGFQGLIEYITTISGVLSRVDERLAHESIYSLPKMITYLGLENAKQHTNLYKLSKFCIDDLNDEDYVENIACLEEIDSFTSLHWHWIMSISNTDGSSFSTNLDSVLMEAFLAKAKAYNKSLIQASEERILV